MRRLVITSVTLITVLAACQPAARVLSDDEKAAIAEAVSAVHAEFVSACEAVDIDLAMTYWQDSPETTYAFAWASGRRILRDVSEIRALVEPVYDRFGGQKYNVAETHTLVIAPDVASIVERGTFAWVDREGNLGSEQPYLLTTVYVLRDGSWKVLGIHEST